MAPGKGIPKRKTSDPLVFPQRRTDKPAEKPREKKTPRPLVPSGA